MGENIPTILVKRNLFNEIISLLLLAVQAVPRERIESHLYLQSIPLRGTSNMVHAMVFSFIQCSVEYHTVITSI